LEPASASKPREQFFPYCEHGETRRAFATTDNPQAEESDTSQKAGRDAQELNSAPMLEESPVARF
jgi:hypothetical protein